jgi:PAS domain S-box-containing protein
MKEPLHILHLEDDSMDASLVAAILKGEKISCEITRVCDAREFQATLAEKKIDLILSDFSMPGFDGLSALKIARVLTPEVPFLFLSGTIGEELAVEALKEGATDYILKDRMTRLPMAVRRALAEVAASRQKLEAEHRIQEQATLLDRAQDAICVNDLDQNILFWNQGARRLYGWSALEALGRNANDLLFQGEPTGAQTALKNLIRQGEWQGELHQVTKEEKKIVVESRWTLLRNQADEPKSILIINTDITDKKQIEAQLLRTQRMETIGALAGGIAHDLNNSLAPVLMALSIIREELTSDDSKRFLEIAEASTRRSVSMVKQILAFSRGVGGELARLQIENVIQEIVQLTEDTFPPNVQIEKDLAASLFPIKGNATQLHQVLLNLCVNARDAMPEGGRLQIEAANVTLDEKNLPGQQTTGPYVLVTVSDTGLGMSAEVLAKIFEPFFTTKEIGKGTGLGLSTVFGIVKTHGGFVNVASEAGQGTSFKVYLPADTTF